MIEDHENAVKDFDAVIKKNPKNAHAHFRRAFSHKSLAQQMDQELSELHEYGKLVSVTNRKPEEQQQLINTKLFPCTLCKQQKKDSPKEYKTPKQKHYEQAANDFEQAKALDPLNPKMVVNYKKLKGITCIVLCKPGDEKIF